MLISMKRGPVGKRALLSASAFPGKAVPISAAAIDEPPASALVSILKALADLNRFRIVALLSRGELCVGEIEYVLGLSQTNVSRHLERLRHAGLVVSRKSAQWVYYGIPNDLFSSKPAIAALVTTEIAKTKECGADARALAAYRASGMTCADLPGCRGGQR